MRAADLHRQAFDVLVVGGGIIGCGVARDAARRGLRVALFEQDDFGSGTSSGSTRLIHGGLRYLEMLDFALVRLDLREREILLRIAPHLVTPLRFLLPFYGTSAFNRLRMRAGMWLYDGLSYDRSLDGHRMLSADAAHAAEPRLVRDGTAGRRRRTPTRRPRCPNASASRTSSMPWRPVRRSATTHAWSRAVVSTAASADVRVQDLIAQREVEVSGRVVVNAVGPVVRSRRRCAADLARPRVRTTRGIHIACPNPPANALALPSAVDGRLDVRDSVARLHVGGHDRHRLRGRPVGRDRHAAGGRLPAAVGRAVRRRARRRAVHERRRPRARAPRRARLGRHAIAPGHRRAGSGRPRVDHRRQADRVPRHRRRSDATRLPAARGPGAGHDARPSPCPAPVRLDDMPDGAGRVQRAPPDTPVRQPARRGAGPRREPARNWDDADGRGTRRRSRRSCTPSATKPASASPTSCSAVHGSRSRLIAAARRSGRIAAAMREELGWSDQRVADELARCRKLLARSDGDHAAGTDSFADLG